MNENLLPTNTNLLQIEGDQAMADSRVVAEHFGKEHKNVLRDIRNLECSDKFRELNFEPCEYTGNTEGISRKYAYFMMTRDGFSRLVMGFSGKKAALWIEKYIEAFNAMEARLREENGEGKLHETERELLGVYRDHLRLLRHSKKRGSKITAEEKKTIWRMTMDGYSHHYIAKKLDRDPGNIRRWQKLFLELARQKVEAHEAEHGPILAPGEDK